MDVLKDVFRFRIPKRRSLIAPFFEVSPGIGFTLFHVMNTRDFFVVAIGASAGGQQPLIDFFSNLPSDTGFCYCVITHLHRSRRSTLTDILAKHTKMPVVRIDTPKALLPNTVYVMPEGVKVFVKNNMLVPEMRPTDENVNRTVNEFFVSLAEEFGEKAIGIVLSGMGDDGSRGVELIHENGGTVLVQDPSSTIFKSMPENAIERDHPIRVLSPAALAKDLKGVIKQQIKERESAR